MNILMLTEYYHPFQFGGAELSSYYLAKGLSNRKHNVRVLTPNYGASATEKQTDVTVVRYPFYKKLTSQSPALTPFHQTNPLWHLLLTIFLMREVIRFRPVILHVQGKYMLPATVLIGKIFRIKVVATLRDYIVLCPLGFCIRKDRNFSRCSFYEFINEDLRQYINKPNSSSTIYIGTGLRAISGWMYAKILTFFLKHTDSNIAISKFLAQIYRNNRVTIYGVIYNSFEKKRLHARRPRMKKIVFAGRLTPGKGLPLLLDAYHELEKELDYHLPDLWIIGRGPIQSSNITSKKVKFLGPMSYEETQQIIASSYLVVQPSVWEEPFGRVALEAILQGVPVVATNRGGLNEIVKDGKYGLLVEANRNALKKGILKALQLNNEFRNQIEKNRTAIESKFVINPTIEYISLYKKLL